MSVASALDEPLVSAVRTERRWQWSGRQVIPAAVAALAVVVGSLAVAAFVLATSPASSSSPAEAAPVATQDTRLPEPSSIASFPGYYVDDSFSVSQLPTLRSLNADVPIGAAVYVSASSGSDASDGRTPASPLRTLPAAQLVVRGLLPSVLGSVVVYLSPGFYQLNSTLEFGASDSFSSRFPDRLVIYTSSAQPDPLAAQQSEPAVISGGVQLPGDGWKQVDGALNLWRYDVPVELANLSLVRNVWVDDQRLVKAATPLLNVPISAANNSVDCSACGLPAVSEPCAVEVAGLLGFQMSRCQAVLHPNHTLLIDRDCWSWMLLGPYGFTFPVTWLENSRCFLTQPGQGAIDSANQAIYYIPPPGRNVSASRLVVPALNTLLLLNGTSNLAFVGLQFSHSNWRQASTGIGYFTDQADLLKRGVATLDAAPNDGTFWSIPAAVWCYQCSAVAFVQSTFAHLGNTALWVDILSSGNLVWLNRFYDVSGSGVRVGRYPTVYATTSTHIQDNWVHDTGKEYIGSCGIYVAYASHTLISHNSVHDIPYTGISAGLGWTADYNPLNVRSLLTNNHVYRVMSMLCDGGGIYMCARQDGSLVAQNHIHHIDTADSYWARYVDVFLCPGQGLYLDGGSSINTTYVERDNVFDHILQFGYGLDFTATQPGSPPSFVEPPDYATNDYVEMHAGARQLPLHLRDGQVLAFGGMYGSSYNNPLTDRRSCLKGYADRQVLYTSGTDEAVYYCWSVAAAAEQAEFVFGGAFSNSTWQSYPNPLACEHCYGCPDSTFDVHAILGDSAEQDSPLYYCMRRNNASDARDAALVAQFGGMFGYGSSEEWGALMYPGVLTATDACRPSEKAAQVLGIPLFDYPLSLCLSGLSAASAASPALAFAPVAAPSPRSSHAGLLAPSCPVRQYANQSLSFGGLLGTINGSPASNYVTGSLECPAGYTAQRIYGGSLDTTIDYALSLCYAFVAPGAAVEWEFGGAFGGDFVNPFTDSASCPSGFDMVQALGTAGVDSPFAYCVRRAEPGGSEFGAAFGGFMGSSPSRDYDNALSTTAHCPGGFNRSQVFGSATPLDYPLYACLRLSASVLQPLPTSVIRQAAMVTSAGGYEDQFGLRWLPLPCDESAGCSALLSNASGWQAYNSLDPLLYSALLSSNSALQMAWAVPNGRYSVTLLLLDMLHAAGGPLSQLDVRVNGELVAGRYQPAPSVDYRNRANNLVIEQVQVAAGVLQVNVSGVGVVLSGIQVQPTTLPNNYATLPPSAFFLPLERDFIERTTGLNASTNSRYQYPELVFDPAPPRASALTTVPPGALNYGDVWLVAAPYPAGGLASSYSKCIWVSLSPLNAGSGPYNLLGSAVPHLAGSHSLSITDAGVLSVGHGASGQPGATFAIPGFTNNSWHHVCGVYSAGPASAFTLYHNGEQAASSVTAQQQQQQQQQPVWTGGLPVTIGAQRDAAGSGTAALQGAVQCAQWYPSALSGPQVASIYSLQVGGTCAYSRDEMAAAAAHAPLTAAPLSSRSSLPEVPSTFQTPSAQL